MDVCTITGMTARGRLRVSRSSRWCWVQGGGMYMATRLRCIQREMCEGAVSGLWEEGEDGGTRTQMGKRAREVGLEEGVLLLWRTLDLGGVGGRKLGSEGQSLSENSEQRSLMRWRVYWKF
ncbi:immunity protein CdiI-like protein [Encephalitozoon cuniculi]|uniref:Uncharacterized protein n=1 Tax=Encephalitozoon cuniculi TaxID=6035 RepID=M1KB82_ENCCN|nr:hypothetical protein ECU01_0030 [Encephalitozoon cuniculi]PKY37099.1 hypothetical protein RhiirB3_345817 [Rhizophagus irregularis]UYI28360.1 immunity protein CdiI-like protein [Encephalitozoon cuniculi]UYI28537.1 immunity protein CdiI-like protein [Encephalitozoon cuniculi]